MALIRRSVAGAFLSRTRRRQSETRSRIDSSPMPGRRRSASSRSNPFPSSCTSNVTAQSHWYRTDTNPLRRGVTHGIPNRFLRDPIEHRPRDAGGSRHRVRRPRRHRFPCPLRRFPRELVQRRHEPEVVEHRGMHGMREQAHFLASFLPRHRAPRAAAPRARILRVAGRGRDLKHQRGDVLRRRNRAARARARRAHDRPPR